jgi:hypothetical protein
MSYVRFVVNNRVLFNGEFHPGAPQPKFIEDMADRLKPGSLQRPEPHMMAAMTTVGLAVARQADIEVDIATGPNWWTLNVKEN